MESSETPIETDDRLLELEARLDDKVSILVAEGNEAGFSTAEVLDALENVVLNQRVIYTHDPDPADDPN